MRKKKRITSTSIMLCFLSITILFVGIAYSALMQKIDIIGKVSIGEKDESVNNYTVTYLIQNKWYSNGKYYYMIKMTLYNNTDRDLNGWNISIKAPENAEIVSYAGTNCTLNNGTIYFSNVSYNEVVSAKGNVDFEFQVATTEQYYNPSDIIINGNMAESPEKPDNPPQEVEKKANISIEKQNSWETGEYYFSQILITIKNTGDVEITSWKFNVQFLNDTTIEQIWNANVQEMEKSKYMFSNTSYNGVIATNAEVSFGIIIKSNKQQNDFEATDIILK